MEQMHEDRDRASSGDFMKKTKPMRIVRAFLVTMIAGALLLVLLALALGEASALMTALGAEKETARSH